VSKKHFSNYLDSVRKFKAALLKAQGIEAPKPKDETFQCCEAQNFVVSPPICLQNL
jgi:hypothetical protein